MSSFIDLAKQYVSWDPNPETRQAVQELIDQQNEAKLQQLLGKRVQFGTAGLRAAMGPGYACMNDLVVLQTCQGLSRYLESVDPQAKQKVRGNVGILCCFNSIAGNCCWVRS
jgi:hypothetical protein